MVKNIFELTSALQIFIYFFVLLFCKTFFDSWVSWCFPSVSNHTWKFEGKCPMGNENSWAHLEWPRRSLDELIVELNPRSTRTKLLTFYMKSIHIEVDHRSFWLLDILSQRFPSLKLDIWIPFSDTEFNLCSFFVTDQQASLCSSFVLSENLQLMHPTSLVTDKFL